MWRYEVVQDRCPTRAAPDPRLRRSGYRGFLHLLVYLFGMLVLQTWRGRVMPIVSDRRLGCRKGGRL